MGKVIAATFLSLDGVMQAPGGPEKDPTGGFNYGGWTVNYRDDSIGEIMGKTAAEPFDLLRGPWIPCVRSIDTACTCKFGETSIRSREPLNCPC